MGRHQSVDKEVKKSLKWLEKQEGVSKIVIGISECCRHKFPPGFLKCKLDTDAGFTINAYSGNGVTDIFVRVNPITLRDDIKTQIQQKFMI